MSQIVRLAVASDLHAHATLIPAPSHLDIQAPDDSPFLHPITGLLTLISEKGLSADALICPGDLGHQANPSAIKYSWRALDQIGTKLGASIVTATAGNHDMDSRRKHNDHAADHILKGLVPTFPLKDPNLDDRYWARSYAIRDCGAYRLLVLNSSAYHGTTPVEKNHGRIDEHTLTAIASDLKSRTPLAINVVLCHHHPHQHSELGLGEEDVMKRGQQLLDLLGRGELGQWMVIHGHKHHPKITYAAGGSMSPVVFAAGSLCSTLFLNIQPIARNQFYLVEFNLHEIEQFGLVGKIKAWDWLPGIGWELATGRSGISAEIGFGCRTSPVLLANKIAKVVLAHTTALPWSEVERAVPEVAFLLPQDFKQLEAQLSTRHSIKIGQNLGAPVEIGVTA